MDVQKQLTERLATAGTVSSSERGQIECTLFALWQNAEGIEREQLAGSLQQTLRGHAQAVLYQILRRTDNALVDQAVDQVLINMPKFRGDSLFSTWAHRILTNVMYDQRRLDRQRKEVSMDVPGFDLPGDNTIEMTNLLLTVEKVLNKEDYEIFKHVVLLGETHEEAGAALKIAKATLSRRWERIARTLRDAFTK